jgi:hypothetical protein
LEKKRDGRLKKSQEMSALGMSPGQQEKALATYDLEISAIDNSIKKINERKQTALKFLSQNPETAIAANNVSAAEAEAARKEELRKEEEKRLSNLEKARRTAAEEEKAMIEAVREGFELRRSGNAQLEDLSNYWQLYGAQSEKAFLHAMATDRQYWEDMSSQGVTSYKQYLEKFKSQVISVKEFGNLIAPPEASQVVKTNYQKIITTMNGLAQETSGGIRVGGQAMVGEINSMISSTSDAFGQLFEDMASGSDYAVKDFGNAILSAVAGFMQTLGKAMIAAAVASETFQKTLLLSPGTAIVAGAALIAAAGAVKGIMKRGIAGRQSGTNQQSGGTEAPGIRMFAEGGIISGPTVGMMGEYPGAKSNPEVVAPLNKLKDMIGGDMGGGQLMARISGQDLLIMLDRAETYRGRVR